ncbi:MAG: hypothetical protein H0U94_13910, partial [Acidobacteria bacterium]|nr:hypothetical protein [Acidobacteriota bacterium]
SDTVQVRHTSANDPNTDTVTTLFIGTVSGTFTTTTKGADPADTTPDAFSFNTLTGVNPHTTQTSNVVSISEVDAGTPISIANGEYKLNNDNWTAAAGVLSASNTVQVRHTSANDPNTDTVTTLFLGSVSGTFTTTTK